MHKKSDRHQRYYFSGKLKDHLSKISKYPLTIVEAPSGFGKTTAIREYLNESTRLESKEYWYTCLGESAAASWMGICELFSNVNKKTADNMLNLSIPTIDTLFYISAYLRNISCNTDTYLVIDNYQLVDFDASNELISVLSSHRSTNLHIIFITQQIKEENKFSVLNNNIYIINSLAFSFDKDGISSLFHIEGVKISSEDIESVYLSTEGWAAAIKLQIINYKENGLICINSDIIHLIETALYNKLTPRQKDFLICVSVLDSFTARQAAIMIGEKTLPEDIWHLLKYNDFIRLIPNQPRYVMHSILRHYLLDYLFYNLSEEYQSNIYRKAGYACALISDYCPAANFFFKIKDFDAIFSLPFSREYFDNHKNMYKPDFMENLIHVCPEEIMCKYPFTLLVLGHQTLACGQYETYKKICGILRLIIQSNSCFDYEILQKIKGEYIFLSSMSYFNDVSKLKEAQKISWEILNKPSEIVSNGMMCTYASPSVLSLFWREIGNLEFTIQQIEDMSFIYRKLTKGQDIGTRNVIHAETMLMRGNDNEAEISCHKAIYEAREHNQINICLCAELILARIAILRGDVDGYFTSIRNMQDYSKENSSLTILRMVEHCMSIIGLILDVRDYVAPWFFSMESIKKILYFPAVPIAQILHLNLLLKDKKYNEFYAICQLAIDKSKNPTENIKYLMPYVYQLIMFSIAKRSNGSYLEAQKYLREALEIALPDKIYLPFAQIDDMDGFLSELIIRTQSSESIISLKSLCRRQQIGIRAIKRAIFKDKSPLTPREREIAELAKNRLSAKEIADKLYISESTVRTIFRSIYSKLNIHSRTELYFKEF